MQKKKFDLAPLGNIDARRIKNSTKRLVLSGQMIELYEYEHPYFYNRSPQNTRGACSALANTNTAPRREDNLSVARTMIRRLIATNENAWHQRLKFITYTFAKNIENLDEANSYWKEFNKKMRKEFGSLKYLAVVEFQKRGAVHYHVLYFNFPYIHNIKERIAKIWGHGFIKIIVLKNIRNIGAYVAKYLQKEMIDSKLVGRKAYFCSRGLWKPIEIRKEKSIAEFLKRHILNAEIEKRYTSSHYGEIIYRQQIQK